MSNRPPLTDDEWPDAIANLHQDFAGNLNVYRVMAHHPELLKAWAPLREHVVNSSALGPERSEIVILRTAHRFGSRYEWMHHVARARALGMSNERIRSIKDGADGEDKLIVRGVDALIDDKKLSKPLETQLADQLGHKGVFDLIATVGFYSVLGFLLLTYDTPVDPAVGEAFDRSPI